MATYLLLGASRGIGLQLATQLSRRGETVLATCRGGSAALQELPIRVFEGIELTSARDLAELDRRLGDTRIDVLVHVAGVLRGDTFDTVTLEAMREHFEVNTLAPLASIRQLAPRIEAGGKAFVVSSRVGSIADNGSGGNYAYRVSKAAVNMVGVNLAHDLRAHDVAVILLHPGYVRTDMTGRRGHLSPEESAAGLIEQMDRLGLDETGTFWHANGERLAW